MDTDNLKYLQSNLRHTNFEERLNTDLENTCDPTVPEFTLRTHEILQRVARKERAGHKFHTDKGSGMTGRGAQPARRPRRAQGAKKQGKGNLQRLAEAGPGEKRCKEGLFKLL